jgi:hypothetical protein
MGKKVEVKGKLGKFEGTWLVFPSFLRLVLKILTPVQ